MREIKFRARDTESGLWYSASSNGIVEHGLVVFWVMLDEGRLDIETLGQYISCKDKNGKEIYEGDVVRIYNYESDNEDAKLTEMTKPHQIKWMYNYPQWGHWSLVSLTLYNLQYVGGFDKLEVIGNVWESPELIGGRP